MINLVVPSLSFPFSASPTPLPLPLLIPPFALAFPHVSLLVHSQSRLCSPLRSLFSSLQAPVPKSFCQSLRPSSTTWYKLHSSFLSCSCVACVYGHVWVSLWQPCKAVMLFRGPLLGTYFFFRGWHRLNYTSFLVTSSQYFRHQRCLNVRQRTEFLWVSGVGNKIRCWSNLGSLSSLPCAFFISSAPRPWWRNAVYSVL